MSESRYLNAWAFLESAWDEPRREVDLCRDCGAVVWSEETHDAWHRGREPDYGQFTTITGIEDPEWEVEYDCGHRLTGRKSMGGTIPALCPVCDTPQVATLQQGP